MERTRGEAPTAANPESTSVGRKAPSHSRGPNPGPRESYFNDISLGVSP